MHSTILVSVGVFFSLLGVLLARGWAYICLCAAMEGCWVGLVLHLGCSALVGGEVGVLFWAICGVLFAAVELCLCLFAFVVYSDLAGAGGLDVCQP